MNEHVVAYHHENWMWGIGVNARLHHYQAKYRAMCEQHDYRKLEKQREETKRES